ncbi:DNA excision repair protein ERCC-5-like isoform X2 [Diabrotica undecimpunctata]|uniref:DNA excision repair protein ERCC-5-like isoform X2 n=1 Tax=Diabrotica undecimpunctata TaxID=50387 RepID=UPI003B63A2BB
MGVHGLWKLIESSGKPIPLETLENKVLAAKRNQYKSKNASEADRLQKQLLSTLLKHTAISKVLSEKTKASLPVIKKSSGKYDNLYAPPTEEFESVLSSTDDELDESSETTTTDSSPTKQWDLHTIDTTSHYFKSLPLEVKHDILTDLKETRKQNSWGKLHQLPKQSDDFSSYQMKRLLKRKEVQSALDEVSKEMGGMSLSLAELESLLKDQGIKTTNDSNIGKRIASDDKTRYLYIKDIQEEIKKAEKADSKNKEMPVIMEEETEEEELKKAIQLSLEEIPSTSKIEEPKIYKKSKADIEEEEELKLAIQLSLEGDQSIQNKKAKHTFLENFNDEDSESDSGGDDFLPTPKSKKALHKKMSSAQNYMMEYSGLTPAEIDRILMTNKKVPSKPTFKNIKLNEMNSHSIKSLQNEKRILAVSETVVDVPETRVQESMLTIKHVDDFKEKPIKTQIIEKSDTIDEVEVMSESGESDDGQQPIKIVDNPEKSIESHKEIIEKSEDIKDEVEVMSDSGDSDDGILRQPIEIVIDPNKIKQDGLDDLFDDIFDKQAGDQMDNSTSACSKDNILEVNMPDPSFKNVENNVKDTSTETHDTSRSESDSYIQEIVNKSEESLDTDYSNTSKMQEIIEEDKDENITSKIIDLKVDANKVITNDKEHIQNPPKDDLKIPELTVEEMQQLKDTYQREKIDLLKEKSNKERLANNITDQMYQEAQELLELFGVPYVVAPMEAEAQCAFLDEIELTNGTITDDSDIWLFGGKTVYKNFFNQSKYVMEFKSESIEHHFKLSRLQMILLALLVGSDYTTGIQGVGPVTALEILASFPPSEQHEFTLSHHQLLSGLKEFKSWYLKGKTGGPGRSVLKNKLKNITFADHFPNPQVIEAYLDPKIETSKDPFSWSKPDIIGLTIFAEQKFGWTMKKTEEILNPIIKRLEENHSQKSIKDYFKTKFKVDPLNIEGKVSKRVKSAIDRFGKTQDELIAEEMVELEKEKRLATGKRSFSKNSKSKSKKNIEKSYKNNEDTKETDIDPIKYKSKEVTDQDTAKVQLEKEISSSHLERTAKKRKEPNETSHSSEELNNKTKQKEKLRKQTAQIKEGKRKPAPRRKRDNDSKCVLEQAEVEPKTKNKVSNKKSQSESNYRSLDQLEAIKDYENLALELKNRRKRKTELMKIKIDNPAQKKPKMVPQPVSSVEYIPQELKEDEDIKILTATTSNSARIVNEINTDVLKVLEEKPKSKKVVPTRSLHTKDVIHQRLRDKSTSLRNKIKAIEVYRKSKLGPGYVPKRKKTVLIPKEDAELSEESD